MKHDNLVATAKLSETLKQLAEMRAIVMDDLSLEVAIDELPDDVWESAVEAARSKLIEGLEKMYRRTAASMTEQGVKEIPAIADWTEPKKPGR